jgi:hypothetical protein
VQRETSSWPAAVRKQLDPIVGHDLRDRNFPAERPTHVPGSLDAWSTGTRETAKEWARELDHALVESENFSDAVVARQELALMSAVAHDIVTDGYAFALAFLLLDQEAAEEALYRMVRSTVGMQAQRFVRAARPGALDEELHVEAYRTCSRPWTNAVMRGWPDIAATSSPTPFGPLVTIAGSHVPENTVRSYLPKLVAMAPDAGPEETIDAILAARMRGWIPALHPSIPTSAFSPNPTEQEKEEA